MLISKDEAVQILKDQQAKRDAKEARLVAKELAKAEKQQPKKTQKNMVKILKHIEKSCHKGFAGTIMRCHKKSKHIPYATFLETVKRTQMDALKSMGFHVAIKEADPDSKMVRYLIQWVSVPGYEFEEGEKENV